MLSMADALHRHGTAGVGLRAPRLAGSGVEAARLLWLQLVSQTRWPGRDPQDVFTSNAGLAHATGLAVREVKRALAMLRDGEFVSIRWGRRPGGGTCRLIHVALHTPVRALAPLADDLANLRTILGAHRARPAALVTMMAGAFMLASDHARGALEDWGALGCSASALRRFVGQADNPSWTKRIRELEAIGLIRRDGRRISVSPPREWFRLACQVRSARPQAQIELFRESSPWAEIIDLDALPPRATVTRPATIEDPLERHSWLFSLDGRCDVPDEVVDRRLDVPSALREAAERSFERRSLEFGTPHDPLRSVDQIRSGREQKGRRGSSGVGVRLRGADEAEMDGAFDVVGHDDANSQWAEVFDWPGMDRDDDPFALPDPPMHTCTPPREDFAWTRPAARR